MKRRDFLMHVAFGTAALQTLQISALASGGSALHPGFTSPGFASPASGTFIDPALAIVKGGDIPATVRAAVDALGGIKAFVKPGNIVFLKPNMSFPNPPEWGSTTHPEVIRTVVQLCEEAGAKRIVAADFPMRRAERCFEKSGMTALASELPQLTFKELGDERDFETVQTPDAKEFREIAVAKLLRKADVFINLPTAKAHSGTSVSLGLKNLMGVIRDRGPFHGDYDLHAAIADLAMVVRPQLTILDAHYVLLTNGPGGPGRVDQPGTIIAGVDPLGVDAAGVRMAEWNNRTTDPAHVRHLALAAERGVGSLHVPEEQIVRRNLG
ncbi:MAG: DUF362 domain-containing protein [Bacteroidetes bacterium]|nr:DUF362 domain-containing protein [Bacteroidota bacterium]